MGGAAADPLPQQKAVVAFRAWSGKGFKDSFPLPPPGRKRGASSKKGEERLPSSLLSFSAIS